MGAHLIPGFARWCIVALVVANLAVYYWHQLRPEPAVQPMSERGQRLVLLEELGPESLPSPEQRQDSISAVAAPVWQWPRDAIDRALESALASPYSVTAEVLAAAFTPQLATAQALSPIQVRRKRLPLLSPGGETADDTETSCWRIGPVASESRRSRLEQRLAALSIGSRIETDVRKLEVRYWVYLDVADDEALRIRLRQQLRDKNFDNYLIASGTLEGQLSLGLFRTLERAQMIQRERLGQGFDARLFESVASQTLRWYWLREPEMGLLDWPLAEGEVPGWVDLVVQRGECENEPALSAESNSDKPASPE